jgi:CRP/FNR family transcriptional regulator, cyclic AMP receptor protein
MNHSFLRQVPIFRSLDDPQIERLGELTIRRPYLKGRVIIMAEDKGDSLFIIESGEVKVSIFHEDGREIILSLLGPGEVFGELSLLDGRPRSANVTAHEDTSLVVLRRPDFLRLLTEVPQMAESLLEELAGRLRRTDDQVEGLALLNVANRISRTVLQLATDRGIETDRGIRIKDRPTHQEIANMTGTTRESVSRVFRQLEDQGYIAVEGRDILVLREDAAKL